MGSANENEIKSIVVEYALNDILWFATSQNPNVDKNVLRHYECHSSVIFKFDSIFLRMKQKMQQFEFIPIKMQSINTSKLECAHSGYLLLDDVVIRSDMFGGMTNGKIHFRFANKTVCDQFVKKITSQHQIAKHLYSKMTVSELLNKTCDLLSNNKETNQMMKLFMNQWVIPNLKPGKIGCFALFMTGAEEGKPHKLCQCILNYLDKMSIAEKVKDKAMSVAATAGNTMERIANGIDDWLNW